MISSLNELNDALFQHTSSIIKEMGVNESGAYSYYGTRIDQNLGALSSYEWWLPQIIQEIRPSHVTYIGSGFGYLAFALAMAGIPVHCYEIEKNRYNTLVKIRDALTDQIPDVKTLVQATFDRFPNTDVTLPQGRKLFISTNLGARTPPEVRDGIIAEFPNFDHVILCERLFCGTLETEDERAALREVIQKTYPSTRQEHKEYFVQLDRVKT